MKILRNNKLDFQNETEMKNDRFLWNMNWHEPALKDILKQIESFRHLPGERSRFLAKFKKWLLFLNKVPEEA